MNVSVNKLPRLYTDQDLRVGQDVSLSKEQAHYLKNVLRRALGDGVRLFNGRDGEWFGELSALSKKEAVVALTEQIRGQIEEGLRVSLLFAPIKKARMDMLIEKSVELGVTDLYPVLTERTEVRKINEERLQAQVIEAAEQCERLDFPRLHGIQALDKALVGWSGGDIYAALEREDAELLSRQEMKGDVAFLIGPEGGFSDKERESMLSFSQVRPVSLGETILRAETAALFCLSFAHVAIKKN